MDKLVKQYQWNTIFENIKQYGLRLVDNKKYCLTSKWQGDPHAIVSKIANENIPNWLKENIPYNIQVIQILAIAPQSVGIIHKDGVDRQCAFNIPIVNTDNSSMDWFESNEYSELLLDINNHNDKVSNVRVTKEQLLIGKEVETTPYFSKTIDFPSLVNINEFHRIDNRKSDQYRWVLSLRFLDNPSFSDVEKAFDKKFT